MIPRAVVNRIDSWLFKGKVIILFGPPHVGKTQICKRLLQNYQQDQGYFSCARQNIRSALQNGHLNTIRNLIKDARIVVFDDAEGVENIGKTLKLLHEQYPELQVIVSASSRFELINSEHPSLHECAVEFNIYPLSLLELQATADQEELHQRMEEFLRFGMCPAVLSAAPEDRKEILMTIADDILHKNLLHFETLKNANKINELLKLLALNLGQELSIHELAAQLDFSRSTVERFLGILENMFVILKAPSFTRNFKRELNKKAKYYFYDLGFRNALLDAFDPLHRHPDVDALWENFCVLERIKFLHLQGHYPTIHFWRTHDRQKIGYVEDRHDHVRGFEFKWHPQRREFHPPKAFTDNYPNSQVQRVTQDNWQHLFY